MKQTEKRKSLLKLQHTPWVITHIIFLGMVIMLAFDYTNWTIILPYAGYLALGFFITTLLLNPLLKVKPYTWLLKLNRYRRQIGVASFSYAFLHAGCFIIKRALDGEWAYLLHPAILPVLLVGFPILFLLALTSNQYSIKKLSFKKWKNLHNKIYIAELAIIIHLFFTGETVLAISTFGPLICFQLFRRYQNKVKKTEL